MSKKRKRLPPDMQVEEDITNAEPLSPEELKLISTVRDKNDRGELPHYDNSDIALAKRYAKKNKFKFQSGTGLTTTTLTGAKNSKAGNITVSWKKNSAGKGYEIQCATDKKFKKTVKKVKISKNSTTKTTIKKLKKGTYYVRIRTINGKKTSTWSKVKSVKVK
jgi:hypothetical protein